MVCAPEFGWPCAWALAVVWCESKNDPNVIGHEVYQGRDVYFYGWFQTTEPVTEPWANTRIAYAKWLARGGAPWPNCP